ncbi:alpha/beta fold hydrolase [Actinomarinicola tropica]|uniref:Alpha/beta fold hydrolase n=2 Tax=Actinomarinicola tropica TaxID=2789776 RepID=A0A5Q2REK9_9ACTN|nr:alpha/beta fold hydrolase [Actinomarinicola tropica]
MNHPPVLLVHGFATSAERTWREPGWIDLITEAGRTVLAPDLLGHGDAPKPHEVDAYDAVEDLVADVLPDEPVDAIGYSMGARVVLTLAARSPERFRRIVVAGIGANVFRSEASTAVADAVEGRYDPDNRVLAHFHELGTTPGNDPLALAAFMRRPSPVLRPEDLARVSCPVLVVLGEQDFVWPADDLVAALPDARFLPLPKVDHFGTPKDFTFIDEALGFLDARPF